MYILVSRFFFFYFWNLSRVIVSNKNETDVDVKTTKYSSRLELYRENNVDKQYLTLWT